MSIIAVSILSIAQPQPCRLTSGCPIELAHVQPAPLTPKPLTPIVTGQVPDDCRDAGGGVHECPDRNQVPPRRSSLQEFVAGYPKGASWDKGGKVKKTAIYAKFVPKPNPPPKQTFGTGTRWNGQIFGG